MGLDREIWNLVRKGNWPEKKGITLTGAYAVGLTINGATSRALKLNKATNTGGTIQAHCHQLADPGEDYVINDFKGEVLHVANGMIGIGSEWILDASSVGSLYGVMSTVFLGAGHTLSASGSLTGVSGGVALTTGVVNGAGVIITGVIGGISGGVTMSQQSGLVQCCRLLLLLDKLSYFC